jgi:sugar (pentulose or hexulose) kinase
LTAYGVGLSNNIGTCVSDLLPTRQVFEPSMENHVLYQELFAIYRNLSRKLMDEFAQLDRITRNYLK